MFVLILPVTDIAFPDIEVVMNIIGSAATRLKALLDLIYEIRDDGDGRLFSGLHETLLPLSSMSRSVFQQLRGPRTKRSKRESCWRCSVHKDLWPSWGSGHWS
jgi:hypothetical protein